MKIKPEIYLFFGGIFFLMLTSVIPILLRIFSSFENTALMLSAILSTGGACVFFILSIIFGKIVKIEEKNKTNKENESSAQE